jgi:hypothetical protein
MKSIATNGQSIVQECRNRMASYSLEKREELRILSLEIFNSCKDIRERIQNKVDSLPKVSLKQALKQVRKTQ